MMRECFSISIMGYSMQGIILDMPQCMSSLHPHFISTKRHDVSQGQEETPSHDTSVISARVSGIKEQDDASVISARRSKSKNIHRSSPHGGLKGQDDTYINHLGSGIKEQSSHVGTGVYIEETRQ